MTVTNDGFGGTGGGRRTKRRRPVLITMVSLGLVVVLAAVVAFGYLASLAGSFDSKSQAIESAFPDDDVRPERAAEASDARNFLVIGSDARGGSGETEDLPSVPNGGRSDTLMLVNIPGDRQSINVMSVMRDTWVAIPGHGEHKINAALALGGIPLLVQTLEGLVDTRIDHVAIIDFEGFRALTTALGGVEVNNPREFRSSGVEGETFAAGKITLEGESALKFVRERKRFSDGDYTRVANQQLFLKGVMSRFLTAETLTDPGKISAIVDDFAPFVSVDDDLTGLAAGQLAVSLRKARSTDVHTFTLPNLGTGRSTDGQSIVVHDPEAVSEIAAALSEDRLTAYVTDNRLET
ncbi:LCP family protein [Arthrobacter sp. KK5.5]|uniref:LCP family protein n=1 Tax=Arthrobacter sp. KK5.5 TaxID=3373084 RepID=UPI003EE77D0A